MSIVELSLSEEFVKRGDRGYTDGGSGSLSSVGSSILWSIEWVEASVDEGVVMYINNDVAPIEEGVEEGGMATVEINVVGEWTRSCAPLPLIVG